MGSRKQIRVASHAIVDRAKTIRADEAGVPQTYLQSFGASVPKYLQISRETGVMLFPLSPKMYFSEEFRRLPTSANDEHAVSIV